MISYISRRLLFMVPTIFLISIITFIIIDLPPGDYLDSYIARLETSGIEVTQDQIAALEQRYGLNQSLYKRFFKWFGGIVQGDFGISFSWNKPVTELILERLPITMAISLSTIIFMYLIAIPIGLISAVKQYSIWDYFFTSIGFLGLSIPNFLLALILMFIGYRYFDISIGGLFSQEYRDIAWNWEKFINMMQHIWVPVVVVGTAGTAGTIRILRGLVLDELGKDYVRTARAKGVKERNVIIKHVLRIAVNPIISTIGWQLPRIFSGAAIVSIVLSLPTTGPLLLNALQTQDMYLAGSFIFCLSTLTIIGTFISDVMLAMVDPRIKYE